MTDLENLTLNSISYEWLEKTNNPKLLKKAIRLLKEDGGYFPDLENAIDQKLQTLDLKYKKYKETENITQEDINKASQLISQTSLYKQSGNSIVVPVLEAIFRQWFINIPNNKVGLDRWFNNE